MAASAAALLMSIGALAQDNFFYDGDGFYIKANKREDIRIGVKGDTKLATDKVNKNKIEVIFYDSDSSTPEGYSAKRKKVADADFIINDARTEMIVEDKGEGREMMKALLWANGDVKIEFTVEDKSTPRGYKYAVFTLPSEQRKAMTKAVRR